MQENIGMVCFTCLVLSSDPNSHERSALIWKVALTAPSKELLQQYESNLKAKSLEVTTIRKKVEKMLETICVPASLFAVRIMPSAHRKSSMDGCC